ncbi:MAG: helix-turn-helix transcriptional regulator [Cyanophyceae cyanobacterium]
MPITITRADHDDLWQEHNPNPEISSRAGFSEHRLLLPERLGQGYTHSIQWRGIGLTLFHYQLHEDVHILEHATEPASWAGEIGFHLSGNRCGRQTGENFIDWGSQNDIPDAWTSTTYANEPIIKVDIEIKSPDAMGGVITDALEELPAGVRTHLDTWSEDFLCDVGTITPAMRATLEQIFQCPFQGKTKQIYLEGKCLELIALKLEQLKDIDKRTGLACALKPDDVDRIHYAKAILMANLSNPPSLTELAHQVSLNDYKLKVGFKQVFGTTVFGYLHQHRMETARQLLAEQRMNVKEVARTVGYASQSQFAIAFRKEFGMNPKVYLLSKKSGYQAE